MIGLVRGYPSWQLPVNHGRRPAIVITFLALASFLLWVFSIHGDRIATGVASINRGRSHIPNTIHYVYIQKPEVPDITFSLRQFISVYSAYLHLRPKTIYIHIEATDEQLARASDVNPLLTPGWTQRIFQLPTVKINRVVSPTRATGSGKEIVLAEHKSDFVRVGVTYEYGGIYMDWDVITLRDMRDLRESGFNNVLGSEGGWGVISGMFLAKKKSKLMGMWMRQQHEVFDGGWVTHSNALINALTRRLARFENEALILDRNSMVPFGFVSAELSALYEPHFETPPSTLDFIEDSLGSVEDYYANRRARPEWERDMSDCYVLHAYRPEGRFKHKLPDNTNFTAITVQYVIQRQSNYARMVFPVVKQAIAAGLLTLDD